MTGTSLGAGLALFSAVGLRGRWRLERVVEDYKLGGQARLSGWAEFHPDGAGLRYEERGQLVMPGGQRFGATRCYLWRFPAPGQVEGQVEVRFEDGREFHRFDAAAPEAGFVHLCDPDTYRGCYRVESGTAWQSEWRVTGPRKDQLLRSRYCRGGTV